SRVYLRRNDAGEIDPRGKICAAPYRWGTVVIAYKKSKFRKHNLAPIEDWKDLWRPELAGRISMVNSPREVIGSIAVQLNLALLANQSAHHLKAFGIGDVWVAVGWSSDVLPAVKHMSNVAVVPKSGASLWADLWAIPAASRLETKQIGGRVRGLSPLIHQWIEFCLQTARALPFKQEVIPGASPSALESTLVKLPGELLKGKPSLDTNLIAGVPPAEILARFEFLEPLSEATLSDMSGWEIGSGQLGQSITSLVKEASAALYITGCTEMAEVLEVLRETKDECLFEQSCCQSCRVREERSRRECHRFLHHCSLLS
ncbi:hypothetical protein CISIN_1g036082mg, partial [Citrus sinensis]